MEHSPNGAERVANPFHCLLDRHTVLIQPDRPLSTLKCHGLLSKRHTLGQEQLAKPTPRDPIGATERRGVLPSVVARYQFLDLLW
jgi:hypothetical protein